MRDIARRMWDKPPFLLGGAQAQHGAVGSEVLIRDIPGLSGIRPGNPILAGATSFARGSDQKERVACESCVQATVCRNRFRSPSSPDGRVGLGVSRIRPALSHLVSHPKTFLHALVRSHSDHLLVGESGLLHDSLISPRAPFSQASAGPKIAQVNPMTASAGCRRSRFCRGIQRPASLLSNCPLNGEAYGLTAVKAGHAGADLGYPCLLYFGFEPR